MKKEILIGILAGVLLFIILMASLVVSINSSRGSQEGFTDTEKAVICVGCAEKKAMVISEIIFDDCRENLISYNEGKQTFLYVNQENQIIERNRNGEITDNAALLKYNDLLKEETGSIRNLKYASKEGDISYIYDDDLYYFDYAAGQSNKIVNDCAGSSGRDMYWIQPEKIYFISYEEEKIQYSLYVQNEQQEIALVEGGIRSFCVNDCGTKLYGVQGYIIPHAFGFSQEYRIVEIDLLQNTVHILTKVEGDDLILGDIGNQFLLYAEEDYKKKITKVFQLNLQSGKTKCIYRTDKRIIGELKMKL